MVWPARTIFWTSGFRKTIEEPKMTLSDLQIDKRWTLFLDRDGVINKRIVDGYVKTWSEFKFLPGVLDALPIITRRFGRAFIVTNQQGIGKGIMTEEELQAVHDRMLKEIRERGGRIDKIYHSPYREEEGSGFRKPDTGMARLAKADFPDIDFSKALMIGDSLTDMEFGKNAGMTTLLIAPGTAGSLRRPMADLCFPDLPAVAATLEEALP